MKEAFFFCRMPWIYLWIKEDMESENVGKMENV